MTTACKNRRCGHGRCGRWARWSDATRGTTPVFTSLSSLCFALVRLICLSLSLCHRIHVIVGCFVFDVVIPTHNYFSFYFPLFLFLFFFFSHALWVALLSSFAFHFICEPCDIHINRLLVASPRITPRLNQAASIACLTSLFQSPAVDSPPVIVCTSQYRMPLR